jgi:WXG100 family type VII secretion target
MARQRVEVDQLEQVIADLQAITRALEEAARDAADAVARLQGTWSGVGADAHQIAHARWAADAEEMQDAVVLMHQALATAHGNYQRALGSNHGMWS